MRNMLTEQELNVLRSQGVIAPGEIAFRDDTGNLFAENVMTRSTRRISGGFAMESSVPGRKLLLDQVSRKGNVIN